MPSQLFYCLLVYYNSIVRNQQALGVRNHDNNRPIPYMQKAEGNSWKKKTNPFTRVRQIATIYLHPLFASKKIV